MKFSKKSKIIAAAIAMLTVSTAATITGTVAWFTAANTVSISNMTVQAEVEKGIVIANETHTADNHWVENVEASHQNTGATSKLLPTSTANLTKWYHGLSDKVDDGQSNVKYEEFVSFTNADGIYSATTAEHITTAKPVYLLNKFYVQASANADITGQDIFMKDLTVERSEAADKLSPALRIGVAYKEASGTFTFAKIFAPVTGATLSYDAVTALGDNSATTDVTETDYPTKTAVTAVNGSGSTKLVDNVNIKAYTTAGTNAIEFSIFIYFEGEDTNHKSANIGAIDQLTVGFKLENRAHA